MQRLNRRELLQSATVGLLTTWATRCVSAQERPQILSDRMVRLEIGTANVLLFSSPEMTVAVDSGPVVDPARSLKAQVLFNTHYHRDQTGGNEALSSAGAKIIAHERTKQWMATDYWIQAEDRYEKARPKAAQPTQAFLTTGSLKAGDEQIDYGYLLMAHTSGDIYVHFRTQNVIAVGDVASPVRDPALDYATGAWIGGRVDAMDTILKLANDQTKIVPAYGPPMSKAEFKAERDLMEEVRARLFKQVREGDGPNDMLEAGVLKGLPRTWKDPGKFLYDAAKGLWAHHDKLDANVV